MKSINLVIGLGRSGTTLYGSYLAEAVNGVFVGELIYLIERLNQNNQLCGCEKKTINCKFYDKYLKSLTESEKVILSNASSTLKLKNLILKPKKQKITANLIFKILTSIHNDYNCSVVDTSKLFPLAFHLRKKQQIKFTLLIRNVLGVVNSMMSTKQHPRTNQVIKLHNGNPIKTPLRWLIVNYLYKIFIGPEQIICFNNKKSMRKYFNSNPNFINHSISGNPSKFNTSFDDRISYVIKPNIYFNFINKFHIK